MNLTASDPSVAKYQPIILGIFIAIILVAILTISVQKSFIRKNEQYALKQSSSQKTGYEVARAILDKNGLHNISVNLGEEGKDHFNPATNCISLSPSTYNSSSVSAMAIAAHECGHAMQWQRQTLFVRIRETIAKPVAIIAQIGQTIFSFGIFIILFSGIGAWFLWIMLASILTYGAMGLFQLVSLPLEFDASKKAKNELTELKYMRSENDIIGTNGVLRAAAMTYLVQFLSTVLFLAFWIVQLLAMSRK